MLTQGKAPNKSLFPYLIGNVAKARYLHSMQKLLALLTFVFTASFLASPFLTEPFSGFRADQLPIPQIDPPVQPSGYAFAIWGVIYLWLGISALFGMIKRSDDTTWNHARLPLIPSLAIGSIWLPVANNSAIWATVLIFLMAAGAIGALRRAPSTDTWLFRTPIGIYAGWLTAASFVSLGSTAAGYGLITDALGWAYIGILGALILAAIIQRQISAPSYGLTVIWALIGIVVANGQDVLPISLFAAVGILVIGYLVTLSVRRPLLEVL